MKNKFSLVSWNRHIILALALVLSCALAPTVQAASPAVDCDADELIGAITAANASPGGDILELRAGCVYALTEIDNASLSYVPNGLPVITGDLTLRGNGATITRAENAPKFRFFQIAQTATLSLNQLSLEKVYWNPRRLNNPLITAARSIISEY